MAAVITSQGKTVVAEIALYGTSKIGAVYLVMTKDGELFGQSEPSVQRSFTAAVWLAVDDILKRAGDWTTREAYTLLGAVRVFHPGGEFFTDIPLDQPVPTYGSLTSQPVTMDLMHVVSVQEIGQAQAARKEVAAVAYSIPKGPGL